MLTKNKIKTVFMNNAPYDIVTIFCRLQSPFLPLSILVMKTADNDRSTLKSIIFMK
ncbi:hypothetical protein BSM4216_1086 [Bacillus smithii]|nr:hypothetical protein BSM4216_1086 [Bacillus smithii]